METNNYGKVTVGEETGVDYMDAYHCEKIGSTDYELVCSAYQPDWYVEESTEGYPRFGADENDLTAVIFDASLSSAALVYDVFLTGAITVLASSTTAIVLTLSF